MIAKFELTRPIEARKLNPRTLRPVTNQWVAIPFGAILTLIEQDDERVHFSYLGEPYRTPVSDFKEAARPLG